MARFGVFIWGSRAVFGVVILESKICNPVDNMVVNEYLLMIQDSSRGSSF